MNEVVNKLIKKASILRNKFQQKFIFSGIIATGFFAQLSTTAFADVAFQSSGSVISDLPLISISKDMLRPLVDGIMSHINLVLPAAIPLLGILLGFRVFPAFLSKLVGG